jgi:transposase-like protein
MDTKKVKLQYHLSKWMPIIHECRASGMTVKAWCLENNVSQQQFFYWQRRIREDLCTSVQTLIKEEPTVFAPLPTQDCHKVTTKSDLFRPDLVINIGNCRLELSNQTSPELLQTVLKVIDHV